MVQPGGNPVGGNGGPGGATGTGKGAGAGAEAGGRPLGTSNLAEGGLPAGTGGGRLGIDCAKALAISSAETEPEVRSSVEVPESIIASLRNPSSGRP